MNHRVLSLTHFYFITMKKLLLLLAFLFAYTQSQSQCSTTNATSCVCATAGQSNCDLLPDIICAKPPLLVNGSSGILEYSQSGNGSNNGLLRVSVSTPNIGHGPLEVRSSNSYVCGTDTLTGTAPTTCPNTGLPPKQLIKQRVYHKNGNAMTYTDRWAGSMTYHPSHGHMHVDDWGVYTLRKQTADPNPLNWPIVGTGAKLAFCLMDYGTCSYYNGHCVDSLGNTLTNSNFPNYGLGGGNYGCSSTVQGISSGYTDIYYQYLSGMYITIPPNTCNGNYYVVVHLDPYNYFEEENENNNVLAVPFTLTKQLAVPSVSVSSNLNTICEGSSTLLSANGASTYNWTPSGSLSSGSGAQVTASPLSTTTYTVEGTATNGCTATSDITINVNAAPTVSATSISTICEGQSTALNASGATTYTWSPANGLDNTNGNSVNANPMTSTIYTVTGTNTSGCTNTASASVIVNANPIITVSPDVSICEGASTALTASGADTYAWSPTTGLDATNVASVNASPASTTSYVVTGTDLNGCSGSNSVTVTVNALPSVSFNGLNAQYDDTDLPVTLIGNPAGGVFSGPGMSGSMFDPSIAGVGGPYTITYSYTDANGCSNSYSQSVLINQGYNCGVPQNVNASNITPFDALITWTDATAAKYKIKVKIPGTQGATVKTLNVPNSTSYQLNGLAPNTNYKVFVRTVCSGQPVVYSSPVQFTTPTYAYNCEDPINLTASVVYDVSAYIEWDSTVTADEFRIKYQSTAPGSPFKYRNTHANVNNIWLVNLTPGTTYNFWVQSRCSGNLGDIVETGTFTTASNIRSAMSGSENLIVYPNPASDYLNIALNNIEENIQAIKISDLSGKQILYNGNVSGISSEISLKNIESGMYLLEVFTENAIHRAQFLVQ